MKAKKIVLLTGANGFIGTQIARRLIHQPDTEIVALVRARSQEEAVSRLHRAWWSWPEIQASIGSRVKAVAGDVSCNRLGLESDVFEMLVQSLTHIIHCAAVWRFDCSNEEFFKVNVQGTANIIDLAKSVKLDHGLERFSYVSTAYVNGRVEGPVSEATFTDRYGFFGGYEQSKFESERLVQLARDEVPISVFRPTMVVGDSKTGEVKTFNTLYLLLRLYLKGKIRFLPMNPEAKINIIPVDYVAEAVSTLTFRPAAQGLTFHLSPAIEALPTARELAEYVRRWTLEEIDLKLPQIRFLPAASGKILTRLWKTIRPHSRYTGLLEAFSLYFEKRHLFLRDNTNRLLGSYKFDWKGALSA
ncbi:SDR family oxidoreductase, partial [Candidatus Bathyarchaeota archaeon]|nr:SDR family oxidoreductase [Candidatus Bathyarchaeota archaeon]